jgi:dTMP kinase
MEQRASDGLRGRFVVLDGPEGCGKSTQARLLAGKLEAAGAAPLLVRDPGTTRIGEKIRAILLDVDHAEMGMRCEMLLYMAARAQMMTETILPALRDGKVVVCDRFVSSTLAYQSGGEGLTSDHIRSVGEVAIQGHWPDLTIILDMPPEDAMARIRREKDRIEQRPPAYHEQVRRNYLAQAEADPRRHRVIDARLSREQVHEEIWQAAKRLMEQ